MKVTDLTLSQYYVLMRSEETSGTSRYKCFREMRCRITELTAELSVTNVIVTDYCIRVVTIIDGRSPDAVRNRIKEIETAVLDYLMKCPYVSKVLDEGN